MTGKINAIKLWLDSYSRESVQLHCNMEAQLILWGTVLKIVGHQVVGTFHKTRKTSQCRTLMGHLIRQWSNWNCNVFTTATHNAWTATARWLWSSVVGHGALIHGACFSLCVVEPIAWMQITTANVINGWSIILASGYLSMTVTIKAYLFFYGLL